MPVGETGTAPAGVAYDAVASESRAGEGEMERTAVERMGERIRDARAVSTESCADALHACRASRAAVAAAVLCRSDAAEARVVGDHVRALLAGRVAGRDA